MLVVFENRGASSSGRPFVICACAARVRARGICIGIGHCCWYAKYWESDGGSPSAKIGRHSLVSAPNGLGMIDLVTWYKTAFRVAGLNSLHHIME